jgi:ApbE superfamily uncharacterized protein (UPF0280 family)
VALLNYGEISAISYVVADIAVLLTPEQQSLLVQAIALFAAPVLWEDYDTNSDAIDALQAASELALLIPMTIPPNTAPKYHNLFHVNSQNEAGGAVALTINASQIMGHYAAQSPATVSDKFQSARFWLAADVPYVCTSYCVRGGGAGIVKLSLRRADDDTELASTTQDLYAAASGFNFKAEFGHTPPDDIECYIRGEVTGKNASSSGYGVAITAFMVRS